MAIDDVKTIPTAQLASYSLNGVAFDGKSSQEYPCSLKISGYARAARFKILLDSNSPDSNAPNSNPPDTNKTIKNPKAFPRRQAHLLHHNTADISLTLNDSWKFVPADYEELMQADQALHLRLFKSSFPLESVLGWSLLMLGIIAGFIYLLAFQIAPILAPQIAKTIPDSTISKLSAQGFQLFNQQHLKPSQLPTAEQQRLEQLFRQSLPGQSSADQSSIGSQQSLKIYFRHSKSLGANAFALPGGELIFTDALIQLADNDAELIAVFLHEYGHLKYNHTLIQILQNTILLSGFYFALGDINTFSATLLDIGPATLIWLKYSQNFETQADAYAIKQLQANGIGLNHFENILIKLETANTMSAEEPQDINNTATTRLPSLFITHPVTHKRLEALRESEN